MIEDLRVELELDRENERGSWPNCRLRQADGGFFGQAEDE